MIYSAEYEVANLFLEKKKKKGHLLRVSFLQHLVLLNVGIYYLIMEGFYLADTLLSRQVRKFI